MALRALWGSLLALAAGASCSPPPLESAPARAPVPADSSARVSSATTVELTLVSSTARLDGQPFWLAARLRPPVGAHLYWSNPGETGLATTAEFAADANYDLSSVRYPGPRSFASARGAVSYGYEGETVLLARVTPHSKASESEFAVRASWLSCDAICVQETGTAQLRLFSERATAPAELDTFVARLPVPTADVEVRWDSASAFTLKAPETKLLEFFPLEPLGPDERAPRSVPLADGQLRVELSAPAPARALRAVLRAEDTGAARYLDVELGAPPAVSSDSE